MAIERFFSVEDNNAFAAISADWNPLHVDSKIARRTLYGDSIAHGLHVVLWALENALTKIESPILLKTFEANFLQPVRASELVRWKLDSQDEGTLKLTVWGKGRIIATLHLTWAKNSGETTDNPTFPLPERSACKTLSLAELLDLSETIPLSFAPTETQSLFPSLTAALPPWQIASILALTHIVGMRCPGLQSIFLGARLKFSHEKAISQNFKYTVTKVHEITGMVRVNVEHQAFTGTLKTVYRPLPPPQPQYSEVLKRVPKNSLAGHQILIVGASRGLGESFAKISAAGGASVLLTYARGREEADAVAIEIQDAGGTAEITRLDVTENRPIDAWLPDKWSPTILLYCASPPIILDATIEFDNSLFQRYAEFYVSGFWDLFHALQNYNHSPLYILYPSSIALDEKLPKASEYIAAKGAGEALCIQIGKAYPNICVSVPRLPRLLTDQTASIMPFDYPDTISTLLPLIIDLLDQTK